MAKYVGNTIKSWVEVKIENWMGLKINREKTKVIDVTQPSATLEFLGYTFRFDKDLKGRKYRYWNRIPSKQAVIAARATIHGLTESRWGCRPMEEVVRKLNRFLVGWANYFRTGYPRRAFSAINQYVLQRMTMFLKRQSQRPFKLPEGTSWYQVVYKTLGVYQLK
jgi:RNA-directed DNA polymerase